MYAFHLIWLGKSVCNVHAPIGNRRPAVAIGNRNPPTQLELIVRKAIDHARFFPNAVAIWPPPLWPLIGVNRRSQNYHKQQV
jgi:hypothetical protein